MKKQHRIAGAVLLALPFMLAGCGEGEGEGAGTVEDRTQFQPETTVDAPGGDLGAPDTSEGSGDAPTPPVPGG